MDIALYLPPWGGFDPSTSLLSGAKTTVVFLSILIFSIGAGRQLLHATTRLIQGAIRRHGRVVQVVHTTLQPNPASVSNPSAGVTYSVETGERDGQNSGLNQENHLIIERHGQTTCYRSNRRIRVTNTVSCLGAEKEKDPVADIEASPAAEPPRDRRTRTSPRNHRGPAS